MPAYVAVKVTPKMVEDIAARPTRPWRLPE
jgi:hypothetical protein